MSHLSLTEFSPRDFRITGVSKRGCIICTNDFVHGHTIYITNKIYNRMLKEGSVLGHISSNDGTFKGTYTLKVLSAF